MEPPRLAIKQEPQDPEDLLFPDEPPDPQRRGGLTSVCSLREAGNGALHGSSKEPPAILPGGRKYSDHCEERASRPGKSRIPGRDHRRYYHEHWRAEYLMDFNAARHGMICMVCGSSLATLKLSTIKRHIRQKHPYSLAWTAHEKEVIMNSWDAHLGLEAEPDGAREAADAAEGQQGPRGEILSPGGGRRRRRGPGPISARGVRRSSSLTLKASSAGEAQNLERYLKESLQSWFQSEFLMDYDPQGNRLFCMMCGSSLPSLNLDDIKQHVMDAHPSSLGFSPSEKASILEAWNSRASALAADSAGAGESPVDTDPDCVPQDLSIKETDSSAGDDGSEEVGPWDLEGSSPLVPARGRDHRRYFQEHWRVEYLMDYNGLRHGLVCMVCGSALATLKMSTIKRHIQQKHPDSTQLSHHIKALIVEEWNRKVACLGDPEDFQPEGEAEVGRGGEAVRPDKVSVPGTLNSIKAESQHADHNPPVSPGEPQEDSGTPPGEEEETEGDGAAFARLATPEAVPSPPASTPSRRSQNRNYQLRWREEYLMDYDERRRGLICMVCGGTLATLKVSTIKRHILQVHGFSLQYSAPEKRSILEAYAESGRPQVPRQLGPKASTSLGAEPDNVKPGLQGAGDVAFGYKLPVCTA